MGSFTAGEDGYDVYLIDFDPGAESCARTETGIRKTIIENQKRTGSLKFL